MIRQEEMVQRKVKQQNQVPDQVISYTERKNNFFILNWVGFLLPG